MKKLLILPIIGIAALSACVEDEGNYDYNILNKATISEINSYEDGYDVLAYYDYVKINPEIESSFEEVGLDDYEYKWYICGSKHDHKVLSTEKDLNWKADIAPGVYTLYFVVKDKNTDLEVIKKTSIRASSPYTRGFLVYGNRSGEDLAALDMMSMVPGRDTAYIKDVFDNSTLQLRKPTVMYYSGEMSKRYFYLMTEDATYELTWGETFELIGEFNKLGIIETMVPHKTPMKVLHVAPKQGSPNMVSSSTFRAYMTEDLAVVGRTSSSVYYSEPFNRYNATSEKTFRFYPYIFCRMGSMTPLSQQWLPIIYDLDNECFVYGAATALTSVSLNCCHTFNDTYHEDAMKFNNKSTHRTIVYGENDCSTGEGFSNALMKDDTGKFFIYRFRQTTASTNAWQGIAPAMQTYNYPVDLSVAVDIDKATHYHFATYTSALIYSVGNKLYEYDYVNKRCASMDFEAEITYIAPEFVSNESTKEYFVATYDGQKGRIHKMEVTNNPNKVEIIDQKIEWEVDMKVNSIVWKPS